MYGYCVKYMGMAGYPMGYEPTCGEMVTRDIGCELRRGHDGPHRHGSGFCWLGVRMGDEQSNRARDTEPAPPPEPEVQICAECSGRATHGKHCVYCAARNEALEFNESQANKWLEAQRRESAARGRLAIMDRKERPRRTATSRELAKPHPWECDDES